MTAAIARVTGAEAYDLIFQEHLAKLSETEQEVIKRHMTNSSRVWIGYEDSRILCYLGLIPPTLLSERAYLWLRITEHVHEHIFLLVRYSQRVIAEMLESYPIIVGHCEVANSKAQRWLTWLGAKFGEAQGPVIPFEIRKPN